MPLLPFVAVFTFVYTLAIAFLMVSRLPVYSGKKFGTRVPPEMVLPVFVVVVLFFALLISYPWEVLTIGTLCYLAALPFGWLSYRDYERKAAAAAEATAAATATPADPLPAVPPAPSAAGPQRPAGAPEDERPVRLN
jgi:CDP-diacylglycerol--serine O-phosphatidyltransferase